MSGSGRGNQSAILRVLSKFREPEYATLAVLVLAIITALSYSWLRSYDIDLVGLASFVGFTTFVGAILRGARGRQDDRLLGEKRAQIEDLSQKKPNDPKLAWDLARITLEQYFNRNLDQTRLMFFLALLVMLAGFGLVVWATASAVHQPKVGGGSVVGVIAGVITQFIGATFMVMYRSTVQQASSFVAILERINAVGMAVQIIEGVPDTDPIYNSTRAEMARLLLQGTQAVPTLRTQSTSAKRTRAKRANE
jgi:hypothetical protein